MITAASSTNLERRRGDRDKARWICARLKLQPVAASIRNLNGGRDRGSRRQSERLEQINGQTCPSGIRLPCAPASTLHQRRHVSATGTHKPGPGSAVTDHNQDLSAAIAYGIIPVQRN